MTECVEDVGVCGMENLCRILSWKVKELQSSILAQGLPYSLSKSKEVLKTTARVLFPEMLVASGFQEGLQLKCL